MLSCQWRKCPSVKLLPNNLWNLRKTFLLIIKSIVSTSNKHHRNNKQIFLLLHFHFLGRAEAVYMSILCVCDAGINEYPISWNWTWCFYISWHLLTSTFSPPRTWKKAKIIVITFCFVSHIFLAFAWRCWKRAAIVWSWESEKKK